MRTLLPSLFATALFGLACACGSAADLEAEETAAASSAVQVMFVQGITRGCEPGYCPQPQGHAVGFVEVANLAYDKQVIAHYTENKWTGWKDARASYVGPTRPGYEVWRFETEGVPYSPRLSADFQLAINYQVAGQSYWDNHDGADYRASTGPRPLYPEATLGASQVALLQASAYRRPDGGADLMGRVLLRNLAYTKVVRVVFSTDGWRTVNEAYANYLHPAADNCEHWGFNAIAKSGAAIQLAVEYKVNGVSFWDNNFRRDYRLEVPGQLVP